VRDTVRSPGRYGYEHEYLVDAPVDHRVGVTVGILESERRGRAVAVDRDRPGIRGDRLAERHGLGGVGVDARGLAVPITVSITITITITIAIAIPVTVPIPIAISVSVSVARVPITIATGLGVGCGRFRGVVLGTTDRNPQRRQSEQGRDDELGVAHDRKSTTQFGQSDDGATQASPAFLTTAAQLG
jgi:hypothetical protein